MKSRRNFLGTCVQAAGAAALVQPFHLFGEPAPGNPNEEELQAGDPEGLANAESLHNSGDSNRSGFGYAEGANPDDTLLKPVDAEKLALHVMKLSTIFVEANISRDTSPKTITRFLRAFELPFQYPENNHFVPFCAAGLSFAFCRSFCEMRDLEPDDDGIRKVMKTISRYYLYPSPSVREIRQGAASRSNWVDRTDDVVPKPGWPVIFSWASDLRPNHIGMVCSVDGDTVNTVEYNTSDKSNRNGGAIAFRERKTKNKILGYIKIY